MKIVKLSISNFLKLKDIEMNPSHTNVIVGRNKQGKTSILKAIGAAFNGDVDKSSIKIGETKAEIILELDELTIKRTITEKGGYLDISTKEGFKVPSPQKYLDGIIGKFSFNPISFFEMKAIDRKKYLLQAIEMTLTPEKLAEFTGEQLAGLDYSQHALEIIGHAHKYYYDKRTEVNARVSTKQKAIDNLNSQLPSGFDPSSVDEATINKLRDDLNAETLRRSQNEARFKTIADREARKEAILIQIENLKQELTRCDETIASEKAGVTQNMTLEQVEAIKAEITKLEGQRSLVFVSNQIETARAELSAEMVEQERLDSVVKKLGKEVPQLLIKEAKLPVEGLEVTDTDVLVNGVSLDNLSTSEQLKFGLEICRKLNGEFKIICIDGVELLDPETFAWFLKEIADDDFQYFVTRVQNAGETGIVIEDGQIVSS